MFSLVLIFTLTGHALPWTWNFPVYLHYPTRATCQVAEEQIDKPLAQIIMTRRLAPKVRALKVGTYCRRENALI